MESTRTATYGGRHMAMAPEPAAVVRLRVARSGPIDVERALTVLELEEIPWLGARVPSPAGDAARRRFHTDLRLPLRADGHEVVLSKAAYVDLGPVHSTEDGCEVEVGWMASSLAPLFPVFAGRLILDARSVRLEGYYAPPGGRLGRAVDRALLGVAARGTARWFVETVADAFGGAIEVAGRPHAARRLPRQRLADR
jgi:hypothetical protein